jgi:hypothetical protein
MKAVMTGQQVSKVNLDAALNHHPSGWGNPRERLERHRALARQTEFVIQTAMAVFDPTASLMRHCAKQDSFTDCRMTIQPLPGHASKTFH